MGDSGHPCFTPIVLATAFDKPLGDQTFLDTGSYSSWTPKLHIYRDTKGFQSLPKLSMSHSVKSEIHKSAINPLVYGLCPPRKGHTNYQMTPFPPRCPEYCWLSKQKFNSFWRFLAKRRALFYNHAIICQITLDLTHLVEKDAKSSMYACTTVSLSHLLSGIVFL